MHLASALSHETATAAYLGIPFLLALAFYKIADYEGLDGRLYALASFGCSIPSLLPYGIAVSLGLHALLFIGLCLHMNRKRRGKHLLRE